MKLFFSPNACSLSPHIVLREAGVPVELVKVDLNSHLTADGIDYYTINPKGQVPLLQLEDGSYLSEGAIIAQYIADRADHGLLPPVGDPARYRVLEWQNYISTELHKAFSPLFNRELSADTHQKLRALLRKKFEWVDAQLQQHGPYLHGERFTVADAYLFTVTRWAGYVGLDLSDLASLQAALRQMTERPAVKAALAAEGAAQ
ncbi:glutathione transferase GstA [Chitinimonas lacunae]|uniref:Glutathione transferase GstA n=1 Tax=Chitinimonas lacunae TaxID=1963018 RepID=A0ABV8MPH8_9NEIS